MIEWIAVAIISMFVTLMIADGLIRAMMFATDITKTVIDAVDDD